MKKEKGRTDGSFIGQQGANYRFFKMYHIWHKSGT